MKEFGLTSGGNLLTGGSDTDDDTLTPTLVASFKSSTHNVNLIQKDVIRAKIIILEQKTTYISSGIESEVQTAISNFDEVVLDFLALRQSGRVDEFVSTKLACP